MKIEREQLQKYGFEGFKTIRELMSNGRICRALGERQSTYNHG